MGLSVEQAGAVDSTEFHNLIVAPPGSGKTFTMTSFIQNLTLVPENNILALTFTKAAAEEMKGRVGKLVKGAKRKQVHVSTFHSLILKQTQRHPEFSGRKLISGNAAERVMAHIAESYRLMVGINEKVNLIETVTHTRAGKQLKTPRYKTIEVPFKIICKRLLKEYIATPFHDDIEVDYSDVFKHGIDDFYQYYLEQLANLKYWPMDLMCVEITKAMMVGDVEPIKCTHLIVDEYQDTDLVQYSWIKSHG